MVGVELRSEPSLLSLDDSLEELGLLADTAGLEVVGETT
jgi:GTPase